ncbi:MAG: PilZ domain-containing protein [Pseudomonadota bacterium]
MSGKPRYTYLSESDLTPGVPLPWSIYLRSGELLAPAGFVVQDSVIALRLMMATPMRAAQAGDNPAATHEAINEAAAGKLLDPLQYLKHNAEGVVLVFKLPSDIEARKVQVEFFGRIPQQSVIVSAPPLGLGPGQTWQSFEGMPVSAQVIFGKSLCIFKTAVLRYAAIPSPHLFLRYPTEAVTQPFRQTLRVDARLPAAVLMADGYTVPALITNLSGSGCAVATGFLLGQAGARLTLTFRVKIADKPQSLSLPCVVRSVKGKPSQQIRYGVEFDEAAMDDAGKQALRSYVYENLAER